LAPSIWLDAMASSVKLLMMYFDVCAFDGFSLNVLSKPAPWVSIKFSF